MQRILIPLFLCSLFFTPVAAKDFATMFPELADIDPEIKADLERLDYQQGTITVGNGIASFDIGEGYYFLGKKDANLVLTDFWGNPSRIGTLGMIFQTGSTPYHSDAWGLVISFDDIGYVSDEDANDYDYAALLSAMKKDTAKESRLRKREGFDTIEMIGWAEPPHYNAADRKLYWATELMFNNDPVHTLNYSIRALGRKGVLIMNFVAPISALAEVRAAAPDVLAMSQFTDGNKYSDFQPTVDKIAAIGIGGLIAGKVAAKTGILLGLLVVFKKFAFLLLVPIAWGWSKIRGRKRSGGGDV